MRPLHALLSLKRRCFEWLIVGRSGLAPRGCNSSEDTPRVGVHPNERFSGLRAARRARRADPTRSDLACFCVLRTTNDKSVVGAYLREHESASPQTVAQINVSNQNQKPAYWSGAA
jgi:hypothetical protein